MRPQTQPRTARSHDDGIMIARRRPLHTNRETIETNNNEPKLLAACVTHSVQSLLSLPPSSSTSTSSLFRGLMRPFGSIRNLSVILVRIVSVRRKRAVRPRFHIAQTSAEDADDHIDPSKHFTSGACAFFSPPQWPAHIIRLMCCSR